MRILRLIALTFVSVAAFSPAHAQEEALLPEGPGRTFVLENCAGCHALSTITKAGYSYNDWAIVIRRMLGLREISMEGVAEAAAYLAKAFPEPVNATASPPRITLVKPVANYVPVTTEELRDPKPEDWLHYSRTYDAQRFSPLKDINRKTVGGLGLRWSRGLGGGVVANIPLVRGGVMYVIGGEAAVQALDATNGDLLWEYRRSYAASVAASARPKNLGLYQDLVVFASPDGYLIGLDARTGAERWATKVGGDHSSGTLMVEGNAVTGRACRIRADCFIAAHDALTGQEKWKFFIVPKPGDPGYETWAGVNTEMISASPWGLAGSYDPQNRLIYWGSSNPNPYKRINRHDGNPEGVPRTAPAELYTNSTVALDAASGKLRWYYQHVPGDDWDQDYAHERTLIETPFNPDPAYVKWINPDVPRGAMRNVSVNVGEGGGVFALDRASGQFLWATPFPVDTPDFVLSDIDVRSGRATINWDRVMKKPGDRHMLCPVNTRSYWPTAYDPTRNALFVPYADMCLDNTAPIAGAPEKRVFLPRPGADPAKLGGIAKIDMATGKVVRFAEKRMLDNGAVLATAGDLIFHGDIDRRFNAYDSDTGEKLWETVLGGPISVSTITYAVNGTQYVAVMTGIGLTQNNLIKVLGVSAIEGHNAIYVFALPPK